MIVRPCTELVQPFRQSGVRYTSQYALYGVNILVDLWFTDGLTSSNNFFDFTGTGDILSFFNR